MTQVTDQQKRRLKVVVLAWDTGHNPIGRAYMVAEALARFFEVVIVGPSFPRYGRSLWPPLRKHNIPIVTFPGLDFPDMWERLEQLAQRLEADAIVACKPRLPSFGLGMLMKRRLNRPLILDIDDHELAFFGNAPAQSLDDLLGAENPEEINLPFGRGWTRACESMVHLADQIIVSNVALQEKFGGHLVPHARDETLFDPERFDRSASRKRLNLPDDARVVMFLGTPRPHKGLEEIALAVQNASHSDLLFCVVGAFPDNAFKDKVEAAAPGRVICHPNIDFSDLAEVLVAADIVCLPQQPDSAISAYQLPAKIIDALMLGIPVLTTPVPPLAPLVEAGLVATAKNGDLAYGLRQLLDDLGEWQEKLRANRDWIEAHFSYAAISETLRGLVVQALENRQPAKLELGRSLTRIAQYWQRSSTPRKQRPPADDRYQVAVFWKQHDSTLYGRRVDMLARYLSRHPKVSKVLFLDAPNTVDYFERSLSKTQESNHHQQIYERTLAKRWGLHDDEKLIYSNFISAGRGRGDAESIWRYPPSGEYMNWVSSTLDDAFGHGGRRVLLGYPLQPQLPDIIDCVEPDLVVVDVVDDQRKWPDLTEKQVASRTYNYAEIVSRADVVLANCASVVDAMEVYYPQIELLPNACEIIDTERDVPRPHLMQDLTGPVVGYVGNLEAKIDIELLRKLARSLPEVNVFLIGSTHMNEAVLDLQHEPNINLAGVVPYAEVGSYLAHFDVAIVPHLDSPQTRFMNPLKVYNYCAHGVPVVATRIDNIGDLADYLVIAEGHDQFIQAVSSVLARGRTKMSPALRNTLLKHSWPRRVQRLMNLMDRAWSNRMATRDEPCL